MDRMSSRVFSSGFTLLELLIAMALIVLLLKLAVPGLQALLHGSRMRTEAHRLMGAINLARSEAVLRKGPVSLCPSQIATTGIPQCGGTYTGGWLVFYNEGRDRVVDSGVDEVLQVFSALPSGYSLTNRDGSRQLKETISYLPDGTSRSNRTLLLCAPPGIDIESLAIVINIVGRPRLARGWGRCLKA